MSNAGRHRLTAAAHPGYITHGSRANPNQVQFGNKLQGLPPATGIPRPHKVYKTKAGGNIPDRNKIYCVNQLGGIGNVKNSQFPPPLILF